MLTAGTMGGALTVATGTVVVVPAKRMKFVNANWDGTVAITVALNVAPIETVVALKVRLDTLIELLTLNAASELKRICTVLPETDATTLHPVPAQETLGGPETAETVYETMTAEPALIVPATVAFSVTVPKGAADCEISSLATLEVTLNTTCARAGTAEMNPKQSTRPAIVWWRFTFFPDECRSNYFGSIRGVDNSLKLAGVPPRALRHIKLERHEQIYTVQKVGFQESQDEREDSLSRAAGVQFAIARYVDLLEQNMKRRTERILTAFALAAVASIGSAGTSKLHRAPDFTLADWQGDKVSLAEFRGRVVLLQFFQTGCPVCQRQAPTLEELYRKYKDQGLVVIGVCHGGDGVELKQFGRKFNLTYPLLLGDLEIAVRYIGITPLQSSFDVPRFFLINREGYIVRDIDLATDKNFARDEKGNLEQAVKEALASPRPSRPASE